MSARLPVICWANVRLMDRALVVVKRWWGRRPRGDAGMSTAEYAVGTIAAVAFAGALLKVLTSPTVQQALTALITKALKG